MVVVSTITRPCLSTSSAILKPLLHRVGEEFLQHQHDIRIGMVVVVEQDDVVRRLHLPPRPRFNFLFDIRKCCCAHGVILPLGDRDAAGIRQTFIQLGQQAADADEGDVVILRPAGGVGLHGFHHAVADGAGAVQGGGVAGEHAPHAVHAEEHPGGGPSRR